MYVDPKAFYQQILISKQEDELTREAIKMISLIIQRYTVKFNYKNEMDREDCEAYAIMQILRNWRSYDPKKNTNAFAYFTQAAKTGIYMGWKKMYKYKKEGIHFSMNDLNL
jgi:DNA-directed RNA polymerase specialized sigma subunit